MQPKVLQKVFLAQAMVNERAVTQVTGIVKKYNQMHDRDDIGSLITKAYLQNKKGGPNVPISSISLFEE